MELTVADILKRPYFREAKIVAGKRGLHRSVKWVHVVEIDKIQHLLNGKEVILSTGVGWADEKSKCISFLKQLLESNASALCVELVKYVQSLPEEMLILAEEHNFPIVVFYKEVKFIDITRDLHKIILGFHEEAWWKLDQLQQELNQLLLSNQPLGEFLKTLHKHTNKQIALIHHNRDIHFFPNPSKREQQNWLSMIEKNVSSFCSHPISFLNEEIARIYFLESKESVSLFEKLAIKRCSEILSQYYWKYYQQLETRHLEINHWLLEAVKGQLTKDQIVKNVFKSSPAISLNEAIIGVIPYDEISSFPEHEKYNITGSLLNIRKMLIKQNIHLFSVQDVENKCYILFLIDQIGNGTFYQRLIKFTQQISQVNSAMFSRSNLRWLSFGKIINDYDNLPLSFTTALRTLNYQRTVGKLSKPFYDELGIYRLIDLIQDKAELSEFVNDYIGKIIEYDRKKKTDLLKTLQVYLKNFGSKNETARELFIVRQTLYHRLERIKELLGHDFMNPEKRVMIELATYLHYHLQEFNIEEHLLK